MKTSLWKLAGVGALCLALGIAGTAGAGALITGKDVKDGSIGLKDLSKKARAALKGARGKAGPQGPQGPAGINGAPGGPGTSGSTAPALLLGSLGPAGGQTRFGTVAGNATQLTEANVQTPVPPGVGLVARDLSAFVNPPPGGTQTVTVAFRVDGADSALACTITGTETACTAPNTTVPLTAGAKISMRVTASATAASTTAGWGLRVVF
jgi:hypothetical protein